MLTLLIETAAPRTAFKNLRWSNHHSHQKSLSLQGAPA